MAANPQLPRPQSVLIDARDWPNTEWFNFWSDLLDFAVENGATAEQIAEINARIAALEAQGSGIVKGEQSIFTTGVLPNVVTVTLLNDSTAPGNTYYYGTGPTGTKGFFAAADAITQGDGIALTTGLDGVTEIAHGDTSSVTDITANFTGSTVVGQISLTFDQFGHVLTRTITGRQLDHNELNAIQGGTAGEYYHLSLSQHTDLTALAGLGTGFPTHTGTDTWAARSFPNGTGYTWTNPAGIAGDPTLVLATNLQAVATGGTTAQFLRGDGAWSNTLTGSLQVASGPNMTTNGGVVVAGVTSGSTTYGAVSDGRAWVTCSQLTTTLIDFDPMPADGTSNSFFRLWRNTNTTGQTIFDIHIGTNTNTPNHRFAGKGADSFMAGNNGKLVVGATAVSGGAALLQANGIVAPTTDNTRDLGEASFRWAVVRAGTGAINTSDAREKTIRGQLTAQEIAAASDLASLQVIYQWNDAIALKGEDARLHCGYVVQTVMEVMESHGLDPFRYGFVCFDAWEESPEVWMDIPEVPEAVDPGTGRVLQEYEPPRREKVQEYRPAGDRYSLRHDELFAFIIRGQAERIARLERLLAL